MEVEGSENEYISIELWHIRFSCYSAYTYTTLGRIVDIGTLSSHVQTCWGSRNLKESDCRGKVSKFAFTEKFSKKIIVDGGLACDL